MQSLTDSITSYTGVYLVPDQTSTDKNSPVVDVYLPNQTTWERMETYLKIISVPLVIVAVVFIGFLLRFFSEIIIPVILALILFQISKIIVLHLERPFIPYLAYETQMPSEQQRAFLQDGVQTEVGSCNFMF